jgi:formylglycine-generating enzyme required for sulfatase activity
MGSDLQRDRATLTDETPLQQLTLRAFQVATYPVTVAEYNAFVRTGHAQPSLWSAQLRYLDHPVTYVSWYDAIAYAAWLAKLTGQLWRLPTEAEWEKAARGTDGRMYPWGNTFDTSRANTAESALHGTTPVGSYPTGASPYGAQEMAGNVFQWTSSLYKPYPYSASDGREATNSDENRVLRSGSWFYPGRNARAVYRFLSDPAHDSGFVGFRVVRSIPGS